MPGSYPRYRSSERPSGGSRRSARRASPRETCATAFGAATQGFRATERRCGSFSFFALVEMPLGVLLGIFLAKLFLSLAEPALVVLLGIRAAELFLALAEP